MKRVLAIMILMCLFTRAAQGAPVPHRVRSGETLPALARIYGTTVDALRDANPGVDERDLAPDSVLQVPENEHWIRHDVARGDTLYALTRRYDTALDEIVAANDLESTRLEVGQILVIPRLAPAAPGPPPPASTSTPAPASTDAATPSSGPSPAPPGPSSPSLPGPSAPAPPGPSSPALPGPSAPAPPGPSAPTPVEPPQPRWIEVRLKDGRRAWAPYTAMIVQTQGPANPGRVVEIARQFTGAPYRWGGETPNGADCSGFVEEVFRLGGYKLPRTADVQFEATQAVQPEQMQPGDLVFFSTYEPGPSHVGIYLGDGRFIHASSSRGVTESRLDETYYAKRFLGAHRIAEWVVAPPTAPASVQSIDPSATGQP